MFRESPKGFSLKPLCRKAAPIRVTKRLRPAEDMASDQIFPGGSLMCERLRWVCGFLLLTANL